MACCGAPYGFLVALMGTHELREYRFDARPALHARMVEVVERFWREHVEPRVEPSGPPPREEILRAVPREEGASVSVDDALVLGYDDAKRAAREAQAREDEAKRALLAALGDAEVGESGVGRVTFKADRRGVRTLRLKMTEEVYGDAAAFV